MKRNRTAYFVRRPRVYQDLLSPDIPKRRESFRVAETIILNAIDYENFITDMLADRQFIEDFASDCSKGNVWSCLLVRRRGAHTGILVMPEQACYVGYAACWADEVSTGSESRER